MSVAMRTRLAAVGGTAALAATTVLVAAPAAEAKPASLQSSYTCATALGAQTMGVTIKLDLPGKVKKGKKVAARPVKMTVVVPETLVTPMRDLLGISALSGLGEQHQVPGRQAAGAAEEREHPEDAGPGQRPDDPQGEGRRRRVQGAEEEGQARRQHPEVVHVQREQPRRPAGASSPFSCSVASGAPTKLGSIKVVK